MINCTHRWERDETIGVEACAWCGAIVIDDGNEQRIADLTAQLASAHAAVIAGSQEWSDLMDKSMALTSAMETQLAERDAQLAAVTAERDEARKFGEHAANEYNKLLANQRILRCAFCDAEYPPDTPPSQNEALTAHVKVCPQHPMRAVEAERDALIHDIERHIAIVSEVTAERDRLREALQQCVPAAYGAAGDGDGFRNGWESARQFVADHVRAALEGK